MFFKTKTKLSNILFLHFSFRSLHIPSAFTARARHQPLKGVTHGYTKVTNSTIFVKILLAGETGLSVPVSLLMNQQHLMVTQR